VTPSRAHLDRRALNRATLERQLLLHRSRLDSRQAVAHLIALQAQEADPPYLSLWSRLRGFDHDALTSLLHTRSVVRGSGLRGTQHLLGAQDFPWLRPLVQPALDRGRQAGFGRATRGVDLEELAAAARAELTGRTLTRSQLGAALHQLWPDHEPAALAWSAQCLVPVLHPPPNGTWRRGGPTPFVLAEEWLDQPLQAPRPAELAERYLAAFGPGTAADLQKFTGVGGWQQVLEDLRPSLLVLSTDTGDVFDLPHAPRPDSDTPAPPRFLPRFDNLLLGHADRTRIVTDEHRRRVITGSLVRATLLVDGTVAGTWTITGGTLDVHLFAPLSPASADEVATEGHRLLAFAAPERQPHHVRLTVT
jgi:Winged helix DNA-binding domain